jgi:hydrophobic/amphiphilic exporter-1 (mainly G- bacteria), HAE1 family
MLVGTVVGVLVIPGLYYLFGKLDGGRKLLKDESHQPLSERFEHESRLDHEPEDENGDGNGHDA